MKSDLTCPIEVLHVDITSEKRENGMDQVVCTIDFHSLEPDKTVDSVQMNIVCFSDDGMRLGGRLVRAHARDLREDGFTGVFRPEHVNGTSRVEASVEKVWFNDGVIWRREERNVREYQPNQLPEGRELDRLRSVAGPDAAGYAREEDTVWLCVCGRANRTSDECCRRCKRERKMVLESFSREVIESTLGVQERMLEAKSQENLIRSTEQNVREMEEAEARRTRRKRRMRRIIVCMVLLILLLSAWRWAVPLAADYVAQQRIADFKAADAKKIYEWIGRWWPDEYGAEAKAQAAERAIIEQLISMNTEDTLKSAQLRATALGDTALYTDATLALAQRYISLSRTDEAETLLRSIEGKKAESMLRELLYNIGKAAKERLEFDRAIEVFTELDDYMDSSTQRKDCIYLQARQLMREGRMEEASEKFLQVSDYLDSLVLIRRCRYALAAEKRKDGELQEAARLYESLGVYEDAENLGRACRYDAGMSAVADGDLKTAAEQLKLAESYEDAPEQFAEVAFTLGNTALLEGDYDDAMYWLEQIPMTDEVQDAYNQAMYAQADEKERTGAREEAALLYASLGNYEDSYTRLQRIEYDLAKEQAASGAYEDALDRFEGLGKYLDSAEQVEICKREIAEQAFENGDYEKAILYYEQMKDKKTAAQEIVRCRYEMAEKKAGETEYKAAAELYALCGSYLDSEEKTLQMRYRWAESLEEAGEYEDSADAFRALGGYLDAPARTERSENLWLGDIYRNARLDLETGNYVSVIEALEPYLSAKLPERFSDIPEMSEDAYLGRALELIGMGHPLEALPYLEQIPGNRTAKKRLNDYVYRVIGRWKDRSGMEFVFRRDGTCTIDGVDRYYGGAGYELYVGDEPYPTKRAYQVVNLRGTALTLKDYAEDKNIRLTYVGEPTPRETETSGETTEVSGEITEVSGEITEVSGEITEASGEITEASGEMMETSGETAGDGGGTDSQAEE